MSGSANEEPRTGEVTSLLAAWREGDAAALDQVVGLVYEELRRMARLRARHDRAARALQPTAVVHEVYLRLVNMGRLRIESQQHFLAMSGRLMRQVLVDQARRRDALKRGEPMALESGMEGVVLPEPVELLMLDRALGELAALDRRQHDIVELRYFAGLTIDEVSTALGVSPATVEREWAVARAWLFDRLHPRPPVPAPPATEP
ncbi:MAG: sigma-70 family RNA polymerase sigma factor [Acidobacteria bacterium]|nr:sigma-70 family RNA polymerase sigma factor [Acidobacteriota bacterium]